MVPNARSVTTDACVPISKLPEMLLRSREDIDEAGICGKSFYSFIQSSNDSQEVGKENELFYSDQCFNDTFGSICFFGTIGFCLETFETCFQRFFNATQLILETILVQNA